MRIERLSSLVLGTVLMLAACGGANGGGSATPTESASPTPPAALYDPTVISEQIPVGGGTVVGATLAADGTATLLVDGQLPGEEIGCEGMPLGGLQAQTAGGELSPVMDAAGEPITSGVWFAFQPGTPGPGARVAVWSMCEKFTSRVLVGTIGDDGVPTDLAAVAGLDADGNRVAGSPEFETLHWASWTPDGARLLLIGSPYIGVDGGTADTTMWEYDVAAGTWTERTDAPEGVVVAAELADGTLVTLAGDKGAIGDKAFDRLDARGVSVAPDGSYVMVYGPDGIRAAFPDGTIRSVTGVDVAQMWWQPDGAAIAFPRILPGDTGTTGIDVIYLPLETLDPAVLGNTQWGWIALLPDGSGIGVTVSSEDDQYMPAAQRWNFPAL